MGDLALSQWGFGAVAAGTTDGELVVCAMCGRKERVPLWFDTTHPGSGNQEELVPFCPKCAQAWAATA